MTSRCFFSARWMRALASASALALTVFPALTFAQAGPPPGASAGLPPGASPRAASALAQAGPPPPPVLTPAQQIVAALPAPGSGRMPLRQPPPADAVKTSADPRDLQGNWVADRKLQYRLQTDMYGSPVPYTMAGAKLLARRVQSMTQGKPYTNASAICRPPGPQWQRDLAFPFLIVQDKDHVEFIFEEYHGRWNISLDPQAAPLPVGKAYMGRSVGHWDGGTLVVETSDFKQAIWLDVDGTPLSANGKLTQRIRKVIDGGPVPFLEVTTTISDPTYYTKPWTIVRTFGWAPHFAAFTEYNCEEQVGDPSVATDAGLVVESQD